jgi:hypothetical protein
MLLSWGWNGWLVGGLVLHKCIHDFIKSNWNKCEWIFWEGIDNNDLLADILYKFAIYSVMEGGRLLPTPRSNHTFYAFDLKFNNTNNNFPKNPLKSIDVLPGFECKVSMFYDCLYTTKDLKGFVYS